MIGKNKNKKVHNNFLLNGFFLYEKIKGAITTSINVSICASMVAFKLIILTPQCQQSITYSTRSTPSLSVIDCCFVLQVSAPTLLRLDTNLRKIFAELILVKLVF